MTLNFRIVENPPCTVDYEEFKKDFLNKSLRAKEVRLKHGLSVKKYSKLSKKVCEEFHLTKKPFNKDKVVGITHLDMNIRFNKGHYRIDKVVDGKKIYFGAYSDLETARMVRDKLVLADWDYEYGMLLKDKYANGDYRPAYDRAVRLYDEFEEKYFDKSITITKICKDMGITQTTYKYLLRMIFDKYGRLYRREKPYD